MAEGKSYRSIKLNHSGDGARRRPYGNARCVAGYGCHHQIAEYIFILPKE